MSRFRVIELFPCYYPMSSLKPLYWLTPPRLFTKLQAHPDTIAALVCGLLVFFGWLTLQSGWLGLALLLLLCAYVIGGYQSTREGLTTLFVDRELDVDLLTIVQTFLREENRLGSYPSVRVLINNNSTGWIGYEDYCTESP